MNLIDITGKAISGEWGSNDESGVGTPVLRTTNFTNVGIIDYTKVTTRSIVETKRRDKYLAPGDIIIEKSGGSDKQPVGRVVFFEGKRNKYLFNNFTGMLRVKDLTKWYPKYIFYSLYSNYRRGGTRKYENKTTGIRNLRTDLYVQHMNISERTINEQMIICNKLDAVKNIIIIKQKYLEELEECIKSRFMEMFETGTVFNKRPLAESVEEMFIGPFGSSLKNECFVSKQDGYCMVYEQKHAIKKTMDVETRYVDKAKYLELRRFSLNAGDIIVSCRGTIGEIYAIPDNAPLGIMHPSIMKIRLKKNVYDKQFFAFLLRQYMAENNSKANGSGVKMAVTAKTLGKQLFIVPTLKLQNEFVSFVMQTDKLKFMKLKGVCS